MEDSRERDPFLETVNRRALRQPLVKHGGQQRPTVAVLQVEGGRWVVVDTIQIFETEQEADKFASFLLLKRKK